ncbi:hypothetical protein EVAR_70826_1 [Eumeta japonica]|uniref:Uncharacterized protein n=1 Tax=Eumeta variegata TaxID=151549 RepID=A0A4C2AB18_EUMVA|nr:hypothetical protein EVAR_70826_1 [Eumeta japonica]
MTMITCQQIFILNNQSQTPRNARGVRVADENRRRGAAPPRRPVLAPRSASVYILNEIPVPACESPTKGISTFNTRTLLKSAPALIHCHRAYRRNDYGKAAATKRTFDEFAVNTQARFGDPL